MTTLEFILIRAARQQMTDEEAREALTRARVAEAAENAQSAGQQAACAIPSNIPVPPNRA